MAEQIWSNKEQHFSEDQKCLEQSDGGLSWSWSIPKVKRFL